MAVNFAVSSDTTVAANSDRSIYNVSALSTTAVAGGPSLTAPAPHGVIPVLSGLLALGAGPATVVYSIPFTAVANIRTSIVPPQTSAQVINNKTAIPTKKTN